MRLLEAIPCILVCGYVPGLIDVGVAGSTPSPPEASLQPGNARMRFKAVDSPVEALCPIHSGNHYTGGAGGL